MYQTDILTSQKRILSTSLFYQLFVQILRKILKKNTETKNWENKTSSASNFTICGVKNSKLKMVWQRYPKTLFLIFHFLRYFAHVQHLRKSNLNIHSESPFIKEWHCICNFFYVWLQCSPLTQDTANFVFPGRNSEAGKSFERIQFFTGFSRINSQSLEDTQVRYILQKYTIR